jgi:methionine-rich copper-binding protein CopC
VASSLRAGARVIPGSPVLPTPCSQGYSARGGLRLRSSVSFVALALVVAALPIAAHSHAVLVRSIPAARAALSRPPEHVQLWFNERLEPAFSNATVWSATGAQVDRGDARVNPDDPRQLSITLRALDPGSYTVRFRVLSVDGHIVEASFAFTVKRGP